MTYTSYNQQPNNPNAFDFHAYYGGIPGRLNDQGTPMGHGHFQSNQDGLVYHRQPTPNGIGQIAVRGTFR